MATVTPDAQDRRFAVNPHNEIQTTTRLAHGLLGSLVQDHEDLERAGIRETPQRMAKALRELLSGYATDPRSLVTLFDAEDYSAPIAVSGIPFTSLCEHHVMPFTGVVSIGYHPRDHIIGLSKLPRIVRALSRRLQVQERLTREIAALVEEVLNPRGVVVLVSAHHTCMSLRGAEATGNMRTTCAFGVYRDDAVARAEVLRMLESK
jgi:GTP cyclohydrolase I